MAATSATLIDDIVTNDISDINPTVQWFFINDISGHVPVFRIAKEMEIKENDTYVYKRLYNSRNKENFVMPRAT